MRYHIVWTIAILFLAWGLIGYWYAARLQADLENLTPNSRLAGLIIVIVYSMYLLLDQMHKRPILSYLHDIRRQAIFGTLDLADASKQAERVIVGVGIDRQLRDDITEPQPIVERGEKSSRRLRPRLFK